jgi:DNA-binding Lrp family transcriptional regulator
MTDRATKMTKLALTAKDKDLLTLLQANARAPVSELARRLGLSRTTVQDRLRRLEEQGVIAGYGLRLADSSAAGLCAWVSISVEARQQLAVVKALAQIVGLEMLQAVSGKVDFMALVRAPSAGAMDEVLDAITLLPGVNAIETAVILSTKLDRRSLP